MQAVAEGDIDGLTHVLAEDIIVYGDGGGKAPAARIPQRGREAVMRLLLGSFRLLTPDTRVEIHDINGGLALMLWLGDVLSVVMNFTIVDNQIHAIHSVLNPDKLTYLAHSKTPPAN